MTKEELRRIEVMIMPPIKKAKEPSIKEKLHFWWAEVKLFIEDWTIILAKAFVLTTVIHVLILSILVYTFFTRMFDLCCLL